MRYGMRRRSNRRRRMWSRMAITHIVASITPDDIYRPRIHRHGQPADERYAAAGGSVHGAGDVAAAADPQSYPDDLRPVRHRPSAYVHPGLHDGRPVALRVFRAQLVA